MNGKLTRTLLLTTALAAFAGAASAADISFRMATDSGAKGSAAGNALDRWAELIEEESDGAIEVDVFYQNELGGQQDVFDLFMANDVQLMINWPMTSYDQRVSVLYTPYIFADWDDALAAYSEGGWMNGLLGDIYDDLGLKFFGAWPEGFNGVASKGSYAVSVEEASKMKIRVPPTFPMAETIQAMGYQTATIDWGEVFTSIQTGVVDGDGANVIYWDYEYFRDTLDYYNRMKQQFVTGVISMNQEAFDALSPELQTVVSDTAATVMAEGFANAEALDAHYVEEAEAAGMTYIAPTNEELSATVDHVREVVWPMMDEQVGTEIMETVRENASEF